MFKGLGGSCGDKYEESLKGAVSPIEGPSPIHAPLWRDSLMSFLISLGAGLSVFVTALLHKSLELKSVPFVLLVGGQGPS